MSDASMKPIQSIRKRRRVEHVFEHVSSPPIRTIHQAAYRAYIQRTSHHCRDLIVVVWDRSDAADLYRGGFFGKGSLSKSGPMYDRERCGTPPRPLAAQSECFNDAQREGEEHLQLGLCETFFLASSLGLGCLHVYEQDGKTRVNEGDLWRLMCNSSNRFCSRFVAYRSLRRKGFVPRSGVKFGVDFVIYERGPSFYHACFSVVVNDNLQRRGASWTSLHCLMRMTHNVAKDLMICTICSDYLSSSSPPEISRIDAMGDVQFRLVKRWTASRGRESEASIELTLDIPADNVYNTQE